MATIIIGHNTIIVINIKEQINIVTVNPPPIEKEQQIKIGIIQERQEQEIIIEITNRAIEEHKIIIVEIQEVVQHIVTDIGRLKCKK